MEKKYNDSNGIKNPLKIIFDILDEAGFFDNNSKEPVIRFLHPEELKVCFSFYITLL